MRDGSFLLLYTFSWDGGLYPPGKPPMGSKNGKTHGTAGEKLTANLCTEALRRQREAPPRTPLYFNVGLRTLPIFASRLTHPRPLL